MRLPPIGRRRAAMIAVGAVLVIAVLWSAYWIAASRVVSAAFERMSVVATDSGQTVACKDGVMNGYPLRLDLSCGRATLASIVPGLSAELSGIAATAPLYRPGYVEAAVGGPLVVDAPGLGLAISAEWKHLTADVDAGIRGLSGAALALGGLAVESKGRAAVPFAKLSATSASLDAAPAGNGDYVFAAKAEGVDLVRADGKPLPRLDGDLHLTALKFGPRLGLDPPKNLARWLAGGGTLQVDDISFSFGDTSVSIKGSLSASAKGLVSGRLTVILAGLDALPDLVETIHPGARENVTRAVKAMDAVSVPIPGDTTGKRQTALTIRNGVVLLGIIPIASIPPLSF